MLSVVFTTIHYRNDRTQYFLQRSPQHLCTVFCVRIIHATSHAHLAVLFSKVILGWKYLHMKQFPPLSKPNYSSQRPAVPPTLEAQIFTSAPCPKLWRRTGNCDVMCGRVIEVCCSCAGDYEFNLMHAVLWDVTPCCSCKTRRFGRTYRLHHQGD
jgi:hypothetical protein